MSTISFVLLCFSAAIFHFICLTENQVFITKNEDFIKLNKHAKWEFQCPQVADVNRQKKIIVTWMLNDETWLKIDNGSATIINRMITFNRRQLGSSNVYTIVLNDFRYKFYYDEVIGEFMLTIQDAQEDDSGTWRCIVEVHKTDNFFQEMETEARISIGGRKPWQRSTTTTVEPSTTTLSPTHQGMITESNDVNRDDEKWPVVADEDVGNMEHKNNSGTATNPQIYFNLFCAAVGVIFL